MFPLISSPKSWFARPPPPPPDTAALASLSTLFLSFNGLSDWFKLIVVGGLLETLRRLLFSLWQYVVSCIWITAEFEQDDDPFDWMMVLLSQQPSWLHSRQVHISTNAYGTSGRSSTVPGEGNEPCTKTGRKVVYLPAFETSYSMWYKNRYVRITRTRTNGGSYHVQEHLTVKILSRDHTILSDMILEAKLLWNKGQERYISIYASDGSNRWRQIASRPKRPLKSIVLDAGVKELLLDDARDFLDSKAWYSDRGIPFRRGYLLHGTPGSGKTSIIHSLAGELGLNVYVISLSRVGLDDNALQSLIADMPERCIALMEDVDAAFHGNINRMLEQENTADNNENQPPVPTSKISLSGLLNALDGVSAQEGRLLFATTNRFSALDAALTRPGRMDLHVEFKLASKYQARELFKCFYMPSGYIDDDKDQVPDDNDDNESVDSGYITPSNSTESDEKGSVDTQVEVEDTDAPHYMGSAHKKAPKLSPTQIKVLATKFADAVPQREFSMAALQGYLMTYKIRPFEAAAFAGKWVEDEKTRRKRKSA